MVTFAQLTVVALLAAADGGTPVGKTPAGAPAGGEVAPIGDLLNMTEEPVDTGTSATTELESFFELDEALQMTVVTAGGGVAEESALAAANVFTVTHEEIRRNGWRSLAEILSFVPGLFVIDELVQPSVSVRGVSGGLQAGTRIVRVMINGVQVNFRPDLTAMIGPEYIPVDTIEQVEIAKGPLSALYGSNAFLATVNVITRRGGPGVKLTEAAVHGTLNRGRMGIGLSGVGIYSSANVGVQVAIAAERVDRSGLAISRTFAEQEVPKKPFTDFLDIASSEDTAAPFSVFVQGWATSERWGSLQVQGGVQELSSTGNFQLNSVLTNESRSELQNAWASAKYEKPLNPTWSLTGAVGASTGAPLAGDAHYLTAAIYESKFERNFSYRALDLSLSVSGKSLLDRFDLMAGAEASFEDQGILFYTETALHGGSGVEVGQSIDRIPDDAARRVSIQTQAGFLQVAGTPVKRLPGLRVSGTVRLDFSNLFPTQYSWRASVAYGWSSEIVTKLIVGRAFQAPSAVLLYAQPGFGAGNNIIGGRTSPSIAALNPQSVQSVEAVLNAKLFQYFILDASLFAQMVQDKIEFRQSGYNFMPRNLGTETGFGAELGVRANIGPVKPFVRLTQLARLLTDPLTEETTLDLGSPPLFPSTVVFAGLVFDPEWAPLQLSAQARWIGPRAASNNNVLFNSFKPYSLPAYYTLDLSVSTKGLPLLGADTRTDVVFSARNLLDSRHSEPGFGGFDIPTVGRTFFLQLRQEY